MPRLERLLFTLAVVTLATSAALPGGAAAQELADRSPRVALNLALGLAGELDLHTVTGSSSSRNEVDLDPSVGFDLRGELPVLDFLAIGVWFEFLSVEQDVSMAEREESFSFDAFVRGRWVFEALDGQLFLEPYVLLPIGFSMAILPDDDGSGDDIWPGWNTAVLAGLQILHASGVGGYFELGWRHAEVYMDRTVPILGNVEASLILNELAMNFGFVYAFGS